MSENTTTITIEKADLWKYAFFAVVALFVVLLFTGAFSGTGKVVNTGDTAPTPVPSPTPGAAAIEISPDDEDPVLGDADATITIYEFSDFQCPFCARAATGSVAQIKASQGFEDGEYNFVFRHFPLNSIHPQAQKAAEASVCAQNQGKFWEYHDKLFENQRVLDTASLKVYASELGLDQAAFDSCLDSGDASAKVSRDLTSATKAGGRGTPYFVVYNSENGKTASVSGAVPFSPNIEQAIASVR